MSVELVDFVTVYENESRNIYIVLNASYLSFFFKFYQLIDAEPNRCTEKEAYHVKQLSLSEWPYHDIPVQCIMLNNLYMAIQYV